MLAFLRGGEEAMDADPGAREEVAIHSHTTWSFPLRVGQEVTDPGGLWLFLGCPQIIWVFDRWLLCIHRDGMDESREGLGDCASGPV